MKTKIAVAVSLALLSSAVTAQSVLSPTGESLQLDIPMQLQASSLRGNQLQNTEIKFYPEADLDEGEYTYIVQLRDNAVANYQGTVAGLKATRPDLAVQTSGQMKSNAKAGIKHKLDTSAPAVQHYVSYLKVKQDRFLTHANAAIGGQLHTLTTYHYAINGLAVRMTQAQAIKLAELADVAFIERERVEQVETDVSQVLIGSPNVWDGSATGTKAMGEGVIVGIIDSGINTDHAAFADIGGDGYDHTNPLGQGIYLGDCATEFASLCNDKLIGVRSYPEVTNNYDDAEIFGATPPAKNGEDYGGHGTHVASTAAGNILLNVPYVEGEAGALESDGIATGLEFAQISGVAPHANIISYQICNPGNAGDRYSGCPTAPILKAIDDAVKDGVDVLNFSISGGGNPWRSATEQGFLAARNAGIFTAVAAGNTRTGGPFQVAYSTPKNAPWYTSVANSTHDRDIARAVSFNGKNYHYSAGSGPVQTAVLKGIPVYAGAIDASNFEACKALDANAFVGKIAVIKRGGCSFDIKVAAAMNAGAIGVIVFNRDGEGNARLAMSGLANLNIPAVFIGNTDGEEFINAMARDPNLEVTISPAPMAVKSVADVLSGSSLIGPNATNDVLVPSVAAPGTDIYAAYADQQFGHDKSGTDPADYTLMSGTSMASPHVAGAGALLKSAHPSWTPDNIRSALMLTATTAQKMKKADGNTIADAFDVGAGRIQVDLAAKTGLIMDELALNYDLANPALNGDPRQLNIPSMADTRCVNRCSWSRTVTATADGSWTAVGVAVTEKLAISVTPSSFSLKKGQSQTITVEADVTAVGDNWAFGNLILTSDAFPTATMPIAAKIAKRNLPSSINISATRDADELNFAHMKAIDLPDVKVDVTALKMSSTFESSVKQDSNTASAFDDLNDGVKVFKFTVDDKALYFQTSITYTSSPDLDIFVLLDKKDGSKLSNIASSAFAGSKESVLLSQPVKGDYYVVVQNYEASSATADDVFGLKQLTLYDEAGDNFTAHLSGDNQDFNVKLAWDQAMLAGDQGLARLTLTSSDTKVAPIRVPVTFERAADDVTMPVSSQLEGELAPGVAVLLKTQIAANKTQETRTYALAALLPEGHDVGNISHEGQQVGNKITWSITVPKATAAQEVSFELTPRKAGQANELVLSNTVVNDTSELLTQNYIFAVSEASPVAVVKAPATVVEGKTFRLDASESTDANHDPLTYQWTQISGTSLPFDASAAGTTFVAPAVHGSAQTVSFQVVVSDDKGNSDTQVVSVSVTEAPDNGGGAVGWLGLLLAPLAFVRRKLSQ